MYQSFVVLLPADLAGRSAEVVTGMRTRGVEVTIGTYHMPMTDHFRESLGTVAGDFPGADDVAGRAITLPLWSGLGEDDQRAVVDALLDTMANLR